MEYHLDATLRQMPGKATWNGSLNSYRAVFDQLDAEHQDMLQQSFLWPLYELRHLQFSGQIIDTLLCRLLSPVDGDALHFDLGGKVASFSVFDFAMITGLKITGVDAGHAGAQRASRLHDTYFQGQGSVYLTQLAEAITRCDDMLERLKLGLVYILESTLRCHHRRTAIDPFHLEMIDDLDAFNTYPWGQRCFKDTVHVFTRLHSRPRGTMRKYDTYGLPLAVQIYFSHNLVLEYCS